MASSGQPVSRRNFTFGGMSALALMGVGVSGNAGVEATLEEMTKRDLPGGGHRVISKIRYQLPDGSTGLTHMTFDTWEGDPTTVHEVIWTTSTPVRAFDGGTVNEFRIRSEHTKLEDAEDGYYLGQIKREIEIPGRGKRTTEFKARIPTNIPTTGIEDLRAQLADMVEAINRGVWWQDAMRALPDQAPIIRVT